jgi:hypothetical protein
MVWHAKRTSCHHQPSGAKTGRKFLRVPRNGSSSSRLVLEWDIQPCTNLPNLRLGFEFEWKSGRSDITTNVGLEKSFFGRGSCTHCLRHWSFVFDLIQGPPPLPHARHSQCLRLPKRDMRDRHTMGSIGLLVLFVPRQTDTKTKDGPRRKITGRVSSD